MDPATAKWLVKEYGVPASVADRFSIADPRALTLILDLAEDVPYNVQMLAHTCWEDLRAKAKSDQPALNESVVQAALERLVRQHDPFYTQLWNGLTSIQQKTLIAVITEGGTNLQSMKVVRSLGKVTVHGTKVVGAADGSRHLARGRDKWTNKDAV